MQNYAFLIKVQWSLLTFSWKNENLRVNNLISFILHLIPTKLNQWVISFLHLCPLAFRLGFFYFHPDFDPWHCGPEKRKTQEKQPSNHYCPMGEGVSKVSERANEWAQRRARAKRAVRSKLAVLANERTDERVAQYLRLDSCLFQTIVQWSDEASTLSRDTKAALGCWGQHYWLYINLSSIYSITARRQDPIWKKNKLSRTKILGNKIFRKPVLNFRNSRVQREKRSGFAWQ